MKSAVIAISEKMAPGSFRSVGIIAASALSLAAIVTFIGFIYEKFNQKEDEESESRENATKSQPSTDTAQNKTDIIKRDTQLASPSIPLDNELSSDQVKVLLEFLDKAEGTTLEDILVTISNCCAFTANQIFIRENGGIPKLVKMLDYTDVKIRIRTAQTLANLANNLDNQQYIEPSIPRLITKLDALSTSSQESKEEIISVLYLLVNMSVVNTWHASIVRGAIAVIRIISDPSRPTAIKTHSLRLLVNLSCNEENTKTLLENQVLSAVGDFLMTSDNEENTLRAVNIAANVLKFSQKDSKLIPVISSQSKDLKVYLHSVQTASNSDEIRNLARKAYQCLEDIQ